MFHLHDTTVIRLYRMEDGVIPDVGAQDAIAQQDVAQQDVAQEEVGAQDVGAHDIEVYKTYAETFMRQVENLWRRKVRKPRDRLIENRVR